jgi:hypothetical protein
LAQAQLRHLGGQGNSFTNLGIGSIGKYRKNQFASILKMIAIISGTDLHTRRSVANDEKVPIHVAINQERSGSLIWFDPETTGNPCRFTE